MLSVSSLSSMTLTRTQLSHWRHAIKNLPGDDKLKYPPRVMNQEIGTEIVKRFEEMRLVPTLFFVDPWGYKGLSLRLVNAVVKDWACECVFFFNYNRINPGLGNEAVREHMDALFGDRADELRQHWKDSIQPRGNLTIVERLSTRLTRDKRFVLPFRFRRDRRENQSSPDLRYQELSRLRHHEKDHGEGKLKN